MPATISSGGFMGRLNLSANQCRAAEVTAHTFNPATLINQEAGRKRSKTFEEKKAS
jgi:hypothetical protein